MVELRTGYRGSRLCPPEGGGRLATYGKGRICGVEGCETRLRQSNPHDTCNLHKGAIVGRSAKVANRVIVLLEDALSPNADGTFNKLKDLDAKTWQNALTRLRAKGWKIAHVAGDVWKVTGRPGKIQPEKPWPAPPGQAIGAGTTVPVESKAVKDPAPEAQCDNPADNIGADVTPEPVAASDPGICDVSIPTETAPEVNQSVEEGTDGQPSAVETCEDCSGPQDPCPRDDDEPSCPMLEQPFAIGDELWVKRGAWPPENALAPVVVRGFSGAGEPIVERLDGRPLQWRKADRHVLDMPAGLLKRELDRDEARALALLKEEPGVCEVLAEILRGFAVPF